MNQLLLVIREGWEHDYKVSKVKRYALLTSESSVMAKILVTFCPILFADCNFFFLNRFEILAGSFFSCFLLRDLYLPERSWEKQGRCVSKPLLKTNCERGDRDREKPSSAGVLVCLERAAAWLLNLCLGPSVLKQTPAVGNFSKSTLLTVRRVWL